ncbi:MAG: hypothetical protein KatS3mg124_0955 [Porticoccaceae bacterium]|nr:MAG: hypothetical protein KatS3mg124_0955 [Porticoccaceae bacterium]
MDINRLKWASRRGMLELDLLLLPFVEQIYPQLSGEDQARFHRLLACEDQDLFRWLLDREEPEDPDLARIVAVIRGTRERIRL